MESPDYVQTSLASAITLGMARGRFSRNVRLGALNLLLTYQRGCAARCAYCGLAGDRRTDGADDTFIRVQWPTCRLDDLIARVRLGNHALERACVAMVTHPRALADSLTVLRRLRAETSLLLSALVAPPLLRGPLDIVRLRETGADMLGVAVDAATEALFRAHRGGAGLMSWNHYWRILRDGVGVFGRGNVGIHLIVGLGESEEQMITTIQHAHDLGARTQLFSFYPEPGSRLASHPQPSIGHYRRVQLARHIVDEGLGTKAQMRFNPAGQVTDFGLDVEPLVAAGQAFITSGCVGRSGQVACNRPYGNERPSEPLRNYPLPPEPADVELIRAQLWEGLA